jgi:HTH-type transcriptional regulator / antitoxin HipB
MMHFWTKCRNCFFFVAFLLGHPMHLADLGPIVKEARQRADLSQAELAAPLGMSRATISAIETGRCAEIGFTKLAALLERLGIQLTVTQRHTRPTIDDLRSERRGR